MADDLLAALARSVAVQVSQLDALGVNGDDRRAVVRNVLARAKEAGATVPVIMRAVIAHHAETGHLPGWTLAPKETPEGGE